MGVSELILLLPRWQHFNLFWWLQLPNLGPFFQRMTLQMHYCKVISRKQCAWLPPIPPIFVYFGISLQIQTGITPMIWEISYSTILTNGFQWSHSDLISGDYSMGIASLKNLVHSCFHIKNLGHIKLAHFSDATTINTPIKLNVIEKIVGALFLSRLLLENSWKFWLLVNYAIYV